MTTRGMLSALHAGLRAFRRRLQPISPPIRPDMPPAESEFFERMLRRSSVYLEYGAGGSTVLASQLVDKVISVDSDRRFLEALEPLVSKSPADFIPMHVDIGITEEYGAPLFRSPTPRRMSRWRRYPEAPWMYFDKAGAPPDLILVDGRFRVACVLESLIRLPTESPTTILLDDFLGREHYRPITPFIRDFQLAGRLASFRKAGRFDLDACRAVQQRHFMDWR